MQLFGHWRDYRLLSIQTRHRQLWRSGNPEYATGVICTIHMLVVRHLCPSGSQFSWHVIDRNVHIGLRNITRHCWIGFPLFPWSVPRFRTRQSRTSKYALLLVYPENAQIIQELEGNQHKRNTCICCQHVFGCYHAEKWRHSEILDRDGIPNLVPNGYALCNV